MLHGRGNHSFKEPPLKEGDVITGGSYSQAVPGTEICAGVKTLTITGGNFVNCKPQPSWDIRGGNWAQIERCSHNHPNIGLKKCRVDCRHRSRVKVVREVDEAEVRRRRRAGLDVSGITSSRIQDRDGVFVIRHTEEEYQYTDKVQ